MELSDYAERILYGTTLADKLLNPESVTDFLPRRIAHIPEVPGRPVALALDGDGPKRKVPFPGLHELDNARTRGHVLHFFANHELLALELMALVLLRFPEAPASFRMGIYRTMVEEQRHLAMYQERMEAAGVEFGEIPVNAFFWRVLRDIPSPLEFVAGMSMTFEQANLDFAGYYARAFRAIGDVPTADVLDVVYAEEIGHVKHGVTWFDRWRPKERSRFKAYEVILPEGLSPIRAKGTGFDVEARRLAGLDDDFIEKLRIYRASKGRPPQVLWFNPGAEEETRHGATWTSPKVLRTTAADLAPLMGFLAAEEDVLLTERPISDAHARYLDDLGLALPAMRSVADRGDFSGAFHERHIGDLVAWGVSPAAVDRMAPLQERTVASARPGLESWGKTTRLYSKAELHTLRVDALTELFENYAGGSARVSPVEALGVTLNALQDVESWLQATRPPTVLKAPLGASGRGAIRVRSTTLSDEQRAWVVKALAADGALVGEPWQERVADLSWQLVVQEDEIQHVGGLRFLTDHRGQFLGTVLHRPTEGLPHELVRWIHDDGRSKWFRGVQRRIAESIGKSLQERGYRGPVGIDAMVFREGEGFLFQPVVEINTRHTMGRVSLALERRISRRRVGAMLLLPVRSLVAQHGSMDQALAWAASTHPPIVERAGKERGIDGGLVWLTDPSLATGHVAVLMVGQRWRVLQEMAQGLCVAAFDAVGAPVEED